MSNYRTENRAWNLRTPHTFQHVYSHSLLRVLWSGSSSAAPVFTVSLYKSVVRKFLVFQRQTSSNQMPSTEFSVLYFLKKSLLYLLSSTPIADTQKSAILSATSTKMLSTQLHYTTSLPLGRRYWRRYLHRASKTTVRLFRRHGILFDSWSIKWVNALSHWFKVPLCQTLNWRGNALPKISVSIVRNGISVDALQKTNVMIGIIGDEWVGSK